MVLTPIEIFENSSDHSVLIIDNFRKEAAFWNGHKLSDIRELNLGRVFSTLKLQSHNVCRRLIGKLYVHGKFDDIDESNILILVFENNSRVFELRSKQIPLQRLRGFIACKVTKYRVIIDLVCAIFPRLGMELIKYIILYAEKYKKLNVHLDAATIELACLYYPIFGFKFSKKEIDAGHDKRCLSDGPVNSSGLPHSKMFKMIKTIKKNTLLHYQRSRGVSSRTRSVIRRKKPTSGTRKSRRKTRPPTRFSPGTPFSRTPNSKRLSTVKE